MHSPVPTGGSGSTLILICEHAVMSLFMKNPSRRVTRPRKIQMRIHDLPRKAFCNCSPSQEHSDKCMSKSCGVNEARFEMSFVDATRQRWVRCRLLSSAHASAVTPAPTASLKPPSVSMPRCTGASRRSHRNQEMHDSKGCTNDHEQSCCRATRSLLVRRSAAVAKQVMTSPARVLATK